MSSVSSQDNLTPAPKVTELRLESGQSVFFHSNVKYQAAVTGIGGGKALALDTAIPTPTGWTTMGQAAIGDRVIDERGIACNVVNATDVMIGRPCYEVVFDDGTKIIADAEHQWFTTTWRERNKLRHAIGSIRTTSEIAESLHFRSMHNHAIPAMPGIQTPVTTLPIAPYTLGAWLGDGHTNCASFTSIDQGILDAIVSDGYGVYKKSQVYAYHLGGQPGARHPVTGRFTANGSLHSTLKACGLLFHKHIPAQYLRASYEQRLALIQGLMDTDGCADERGKCEYCTILPELAHQIAELLRSLGIRVNVRRNKVTLNGVLQKDRYRLTFRTSLPVFRLSRKLERIRHGYESPVRRQHYIVDVRAIDSVPVRCIEVDSPSHFYLCSQSFIPTHNSLVGCAKAIARYRATPGSLNLIAAPTYPNLRDTTQRTFFELLPRQWIKKWNQNEGHLVLANGAEVLFRALIKFEFLRGLNLASAYIDEAALIAPQAWQIIKGRLRQQGFTPQAWITSTPRGKNWLYHEFIENASSNHQLVHWSGRENSHLPTNFYEELGYEGNFALQEIEGDFVAFEGLVYHIDETLHVKIMPDDKQWHEVIGGIDWGFTNPAVAIPIGVDGDGRCHQLAEWYQRRAPLEEHIAAIVEQTRRYGVSVWYAGPDEPEHIIKVNEALEREHLNARCKPANNAIVAGIQALTALTAVRGDGRPRYTLDPSCVNTIAEFTSYQYATKEAAQRNNDEKPLKQNDHIMDALRYSCFSHFGRGDVPMRDEPLPDDAETPQSIIEAFHKAQLDPFGWADEHM